MIVNKPKKKKSLSRYTAFFIMMIFVFFVILTRVAYVQIYKYDSYKEQADTTSTKFISEKAPRGIIYDSNGNILATNKQTYAMTYTSTDEADKAFFNTIDSVYEMLTENGDSFTDDFILKVNDNNEVYFEYKNSTESGKKTEEIRFKRDRNLNTSIETEMYGKDVDDLTEEQISKVNEKLMEITPKEVFYDLVKSYGLIKLVDPNPSDEQAKAYENMTGEELTNILLKSYSLNDLRKYILVKDTLKMQSYKGYKTITLASNITRESALTVLQLLNDLPGIDVTLEPTRYYPYNELASSVLGYISTIDSSSSDKYSLRGYDVSTDLIGVSGIEAAFEEQLKGTKGGTTVKVNSAGRTTEELFKLESYPGNSVHLTIDKDVQYAAEQALKDTMENIRTTSEYKGATRGAAVAVEVKTGRILASVSYPNYDPNIFSISGQLTTEQTNQYFNPDLESFGKELISKFGLNKTVDELFPMQDGVRSDPYDLYPRSFYNYATQGLVPPGSTFKPLTGIAGLQSGVVKATETIYDKGKFTEHDDVYGKAFGPECLIYTKSHGSHGPTDITKALEVSCNYYFYEIAYRLYKQAGMNIEALDSLAQYAWKFGLGVDPNSDARPSTGIEIEENFGQVYNFTSFKNNSILYSKFVLRDYLESGNYEGKTTFVPFDYSTNEDDNEKVKKAKESLKEKISERLNTIGTDSYSSNPDSFIKDILDDIKTIMNNSEKYKENVSSYESSKNTKVNIDSQAQTVAGVIASFVVSDMKTEITSPAQEVYAAIGQGMNNFTPMQLASYVSTLANGGTRYKLHYVDKITSPDGDVLQEYEPEVLDEMKISKENLDAVKQGMYKANNEENGTARIVFQNFPILTGGKTGTADFTEKQTEVGRAPYATYVSFAPLDDPEIAFVGVIYDGGHGSSTAPVARAVYEAYFKDRLGEAYTSSSATYKKYVLDGKEDNKETE